jgi:hypothetical protein
MTVTIENTATANGTQTDFNFTFPYLDSTDIKVSVNGAEQATTKYSIIDGITIRFNDDDKPANTEVVRIYRSTSATTPKATFYAGSVIRAEDLNDNTLQNLYITQEANVEVLNAWKTGDQTIISTETWHTSDDTKVATTKAIEGRIDAKITSFRTTNVDITGNIAVSGTVDGRDVAADGTKLDGIDTGAKDDQTAAEIRALVESATDSNVFTDADHSKLNAIEASATADQTAAEIRTLVESASDSNVFTDADHTKLDGIATSANNYTHPNHSGEVTSTADGATIIADDIVDEANLKISNAGSNGQFLSKQSGDTGGLTWASLGGSVGVDYNDDAKIRFGNGNDLSIFHDASNSYIQEKGTGSLILDTNGTLIKLASGIAADNEKVMIQANKGGSVDIYHNGNKKLETSSSGVTVTGTLDTPKLDVGSGTDTSSYINIGDGATGDSYAYIDLVGDTTYTTYGMRVQRGQTGANTNSSVLHRGTGDLVISSVDAAPIKLKTQNTARLTVNSDGHVDVIGNLDVGAGIDVTGNILPTVNDTDDLGSSSKKWANIYATVSNIGDLNLSNVGGTANDVDGTTGSWTMQEGADDLFLINRSNNKKYKFNLTEIS